MIILAEKVSEFEGFCALKRGENILLKVKIDGKSNLTVNKGTFVIKKTQQNTLTSSQERNFFIHNRFLSSKIATEIFVKSQ